MLHAVLARQLARLGLGPAAPPAPEAWAQLLERVSRTYQAADQDRYTLERSFELSSEEMRDLHVQLEAALELVRQQSLTDPLTGLRNRRYLLASMAEDVAQAVRASREAALPAPSELGPNTDLTFLMVDLDHFKAVNDLHGHAAGDLVLSRTSRVIQACIRATDTAVRWGGEEFLVVARRSRRSDHAALAERVRQAVAEERYDVGGPEPLRCTCSIGVAHLPFLPGYPDALSWERVVEVADAGLYAAKRSGRNAWVCLSAGPTAGPEDLGPELAERIEALLGEGRLVATTSLSGPDAVAWGPGPEPARRLAG